MTTFLALAVGNFGYQWATDHLYIVAAERTYFQGVAILVYWLYQKRAMNGERK